MSNQTHNLDDLLSSPATSESQPIKQPRVSKEEWATQQQANRQVAYDSGDRGAEKVQASGENLQSYLDLQARIPRLTAANALKVYDQFPQAQQLGEYGFWKNLKANLRPGQFDKPILILERGNDYHRDDGSVGVGYDVKKMYDISQTTANRKLQPQVKDERTLLAALVNRAPVQIMAVDDLGGRAALFDPERQSISVQRGLDFSDMFPAIAVELAHAELSDGDGFHNRESNAFKAYCVAYLVCRQHGIDTDSFSFAELPESFRELDAAGVRGELSTVRDATRAISGRMRDVLQPAIEQMKTEPTRSGR